MNWIASYTHWLHTMWPAGTVEKLPEVREDGTTGVLGVRIVGDLTGVPLLKFSSDTGARAVTAILAEPDFVRTRGTDPEVLGKRMGSVLQDGKMGNGREWQSSRVEQRRDDSLLARG